MNKNHNEAIAGTSAFQAFAKEFGPDDVYNRIIVEEILKALLGIKDKEDAEEKKDGNKIN
jgi:hypothetical protein